MDATAQREQARTVRVRWGAGDAFFWLALALISTSVLVLPGVQAAIGSSLAVEGLSYLVVWVFLLGGVFVSSYLRGSRSLRRDFGLRFAWIDVLWGLGVGLLLRAVCSVVETAIYGAPPGGAASFGEAAMPTLTAVLLTVAAVLIAPIIEELFFRGLVQRAVARSTPASVRLRTIVSVSVSSIVFAIVHLLQYPVGTMMLAVGVSTLIAGVAFGVLAALTGRLGGAIVAHVAFNATALLIFT